MGVSRRLAFSWVVEQAYRLAAERVLAHQLAVERALVSRLVERAYQLAAEQPLMGLEHRLSA